MPKLAVTEGSGKRVAILARVTPTVREGLETAAGLSGRSLSQEIETRLQASMDLDGQAALQDEIKVEMRGTIAALEQRITSIEEGDRRLWPDEAVRELGKSFAMTLSAVQHVTGQGWRESPTAPAIVAGVVRRAMEECRRGGLNYSELFDRERIDATTDSIARFMVDRLRAKLPPLDAPKADFSLWTHRARTVVVFRDKASGETLETVHGPEYNVTDPEDRPALGLNYRAALDRFRPIRDTVEAETFTAYSMNDGSAVWDSLSDPGKRIVVRRATPEELARDFKPAPGQLPPEIGDRAFWDEIMQDPRPDDDPPSPVPVEKPATKRGRAKAKA